MLLDHASGATSVVDCSYATRLATEPFPETLVEIDGSDGSIRLGQGYQMVVTTPQGVEARDVAPTLLPWATRPWHNIQESVLAIQSHWVECLRQRQRTGNVRPRQSQDIRACRGGLSERRNRPND